MSNNIAVSITADVVDLQAKRAIMSAELKAATKDLNAFAKEAASTGATDQLRAGMLASAEAAEKARAKIALVTQEIKELSHVAEPSKHGFEGITASISETGVHLRETIGQFGEFRAALAEVAEVFIAAFAVERISEWAEHMGEAAEKTKHFAETFGMTVPEVQGLQAAAAETGMDVDALAKAMGILDKNAVTAAHGTGAVAQAFKAVGISANDGRTQMERLAIVADKFKDMDDGPRKVALAMELFGKSGKDMIPFLDRGSEGIAELDRKTQEYSAGVLVASAANKGLRDWLEQVNEKGVALAESTNESKVAWQGVSNVLTDTFAPVLKEAADGLNSMISGFIESYREGGTAKIVLDAITGTLEAFGTVVSTVAAALEPLGEVIGFLSDHIETVLPIAAALATLLAGPYVSAAIASAVASVTASEAVMGLAAAFEIDGIIGAVTAAMTGVTEAIVAATTATIEFTVALLANPLTWVAVAAAAAVGGLVWLTEHVHSATDAFDVMKDGVKIAMEAIKADIQIAGTVVMTFGKIVEDALTLNWGAIQGDWNAGLDAVVARVKTSTDRIKSLADDAKSHLSFGSGMDGLNYDPTGGKVGSLPEAKPKGGGFDPDLTAGGHKKKGPSIAQQLDEELEAKKTAWAMEQDAQGTYQQYSLQSEADFWQQSLKRTDLSAKDKLEVERKYLTARQALIKEKQQKETDDAKQSEALAMEAAKTQNDLARLGIQAKLDAIAEARKLGTISANQEVQQQRDLNSQLYQLDVDLENEEYAIKRKGLQDQRAILGEDSAYYRRIKQQIDLLEKQHQDKITQLNAQGNAKRLQDDRKVYEQTHKLQLDAIHSLSQSWSSTLGKMLTLQTSFANGIKSMWQGLVGVIGDALGNMIEKWLEKQLAALILGRTQQAVTGVAQVTSNAAVAASGAYAATAMIPIIGPALAPAAAATALASAMSFAPLASAKGGDWQVRGGLYNLHPDEMVLPAHLARPMRSMIEGGGVNDNSAGASPFGRGPAGGIRHETHHHWDVKAMDSRSFERFLMDNVSAHSKVSKAAHRQGHFAGMRRA